MTTPPSPLILASASPRRQALLTQIGIPHEVLPTEVVESPKPLELCEDYVLRIAKAKASAARARIADEDRLILAADTEVVLDGHIFGKPRDAEEALIMLETLSGREHFVLSQVVLSEGPTLHTALSISQVRFKTLSPEDLQAYVATGEPFGKAGAYAIQGLGAVLIERLSGSYSGVMGLPLEETARLLSRVGRNPLGNRL